MNKKKAKKFLLDYPDLYQWIYGPIPKKEKKQYFPKKGDIKKLFRYLVGPINTVLNNINYNKRVKKAKRLYEKTNIHRHVMPISPTKLAIIVGADLMAYNKKALKHGMKRFKYNQLKKDAYFSTDTLSLRKNCKETIQIFPIFSN